MNVSQGRSAALAILAEVARGRRLDRSFDRHAGGLPDLERRFAHELAYGTVRYRGRLDHLIALELDRPLERLERSVLDVLRLGAYQVLLMEVPSYAAVSQAVEQVRAAGASKASGLVNAVLRAVARAGAEPARFPSFAADPAAYLATWGSHPRWLIDRWLARWDADEVRRLVEANNRIPRLAFVPLRPGPAGLDEASAAIEALGGRAEPSGYGADSLIVDGVGVELLLSRVAGFVQDPAATRVARFVAAPAGGIVADLCAAPGGKALYLARSGAYVVASDPSEARLELLRANVDRTGLAVKLVRARAEAPAVAAPDVVLVDAPCTGTGTLRRHPDARWRLAPADVAALARVQARILRGAAGAVPSGGLLVYSTCTLEQEENEGVVDDFLAAHGDFRLERSPLSELEEVDSQGRLMMSPARTGYDGGFAARMRRT